MFVWLVIQIIPIFGASHGLFVYFVLTVQNILKLELSKIQIKHSNFGVHVQVREAGKDLNFVDQRMGPCPKLPLIQLVNLALACVQNSPEDRPHMADVVKELRRIQRNVKYYSLLHPECGKSSTRLWTPQLEYQISFHLSCKLNTISEHD